MRLMPAGVAEMAEFVGRTVLATGAVLRGRGHWRARDFWWQLDSVGVRSVPIVMLVSALVGLILAYMGAAQLRQLGAQSFIADLVGIGMVREIGALMMGVILSGRVGAAFAAQLGAMQANEEVDALRALGIDPVAHLVLPRLAALLLAAPLLTGLAALSGVLAGSAVAVGIFQVSLEQYLDRTLQALSLTHLGVGLFKGTAYAAIVALAGCACGLQAGRSAESVGQATTRAVVHSIVWMVVCASLITILLQRLGW